MMIRPLSYEEAEKVPGMALPMPASMLTVGAVDDKGEVVGAVGLYFVVHADPLWVREDHRHGKLLVRLLDAAKGVVREMRMGSEVFVSMTPDYPDPETQRAVEKIWRYAGGEELNARFFVIPVEDTNGLG